MSGRLRRLGAGLKISMIFGMIWSLLVSVSVSAFALITGNVFPPVMFLAMLAFYGLLGAVQGLIVAAGLAWSGERRGLTVDSFPLPLGAVLGALTGVTGVVFITVAELWGSSLNLWQAIPWSAAAVSGVAGGLATTAVLAIARRGALPSAPEEPRQVGS